MISVRELNEYVDQHLVPRGAEYVKKALVFSPFSGALGSTEIKGSLSDGKISIPIVLTSKDLPPQEYISDLEIKFLNACNALKR